MGSLRGGYANLRAGGRWRVCSSAAPHECEYGEYEYGEYSGVRPSTAESVSSRTLVGLRESAVRVYRRVASRQSASASQRRGALSAAPCRSRTPRRRPRRHTQRRTPAARPAPPPQLCRRAVGASPPPPAMRSRRRRTCRRRRPARRAEAASRRRRGGEAATTGGRARVAGPPRDYPRLPEITRDYPRLPEMIRDCRSA